MPAVLCARCIRVHDKIFYAMKSQYLVNCRFLTQRTTGVQRYAKSCCDAMYRLFGDNVVFVMPEDSLVADDVNFPITKIGYSSGVIWEQFELPFIALRYPKSTIISFCGTPPLLVSRLT